MTIFCPKELANVREIDDRRYHDYFGKSSPRTFGPEAFLVEHPAEWATRSHFHDVDQFQIFFGSPGALYQRHEIPSVMVHYADAFTVYGPFGAGTEVLRFFTLRARKNVLTGGMPEARDKLPPGSAQRRHFHSSLEDWLQDGLPSAGEVVAGAVFGPEEDGTTIEVVRSGPGAEIRLSGDDPSSGQYCCVLDGSLQGEGVTVASMSLGWTNAGEKVIDLQAGPSGCSLVVLRFPFPATTDR